MKTLTKILSAAAVALSLTAVAAPSYAALPFAQFSPLTNAANYSWVNSGGVANNGTGGTFTASGNVAFSFLDPSLAAIQFALPTAFSASMTAGPGHFALFTDGPDTWTQTGLNGSFSLIYNGPTQLFGSILVTNGSNLLSGTVTDAWIQGNGGTGSTNLSIGNGGSLTYTSDYEQFLNIAAHSQEFAFNLLGASPQFGAIDAPIDTPLGNESYTSAYALKSFTANGGGNFSFGVVPEPGTWALMIMGFGGVGVLLRRRRQGAAFA